MVRIRAKLGLRAGVAKRPQFLIEDKLRLLHRYGVRAWLFLLADTIVWLSPHKVGQYLSLNGSSGI